jgi:hypothetical protein
MSPLQVQVQVECAACAENELSSDHAEILVIEGCMVQVAAENWQSQTHDACYGRSNAKKECALMQYLWMPSVTRRGRENRM